ncbi:MAG: hypothetical protein ACLGIS_12525 [Actinomycetes bacterium]
MSTGYYCEDHPNPNFAQYGWPRRKASGVIGVHTTESGVYFDGPDPGAENTAGYIGRRTTPGSYHVMADWDTRIKLVRPTFAAWADITNNAHALSVSGAMNAARWRDLPPERAAAIVRNMGIAAAELVHDAIAHGVLDQAPPARRITAQQAIDGTAAGFYGHGETNPGTRYDPGTNFDWDLFLATYAAAISGTLNYHSIQEDDMANVSDEQRDFIIKALESLVENAATKNDLKDRTGEIPGKVWAYTNPSLGNADAYQILRDAVAGTDRLAADIAKVAAQSASTGATVEQITEAVKQAISESVVKVDVTVDSGQ